MIRRFTMLAVTAVCAMVLPAGADTLREAAERTTACLSISDSSARLVCLDAAAADLSVALGTAPVAEAEIARVPEKPKWRQSPKEKNPEPVQTASTATSEGKESKPPIWARVLRRNNQNPDDDVYAVTITRILKNKQGRFFFVTEDGQEWRQVQIKDVRAPKSLPAGAVIERSVTGSPKLSFDTVPGRTYKVRRIE